MFTNEFRLLSVRSWVAAAAPRQCEMTDKTLDSLLANSIRPGGDASIAVGPVGPSSAR